MYIHYDVFLDQYSNGKTPTGEYGLELERGVVGYAERGAVKITLSAYSGSSTITVTALIDFYVPSICVVFTR